MRVNFFCKQKEKICFSSFGHLDIGPWFAFMLFHTVEFISTIQLKCPAPLNIAFDLCHSYSTIIHFYHFDFYADVGALFYIAMDKGWECLF